MAALLLRSRWADFLALAHAPRFKGMGERQGRIEFVRLQRWRSIVCKSSMCSIRDRNRDAIGINNMRYAIKCLATNILSALAALLVFSSAQASPVYRVDFTAVIDAAWYTNDPAVDANCSQTNQANNCVWTEVVGTTAVGYWIFGATPDWDGTFGKYQLFKYDVVIAAAFGGSWYEGTQCECTEPWVTATESRWNAGLATDRFNSNRSSVVDIHPGARVGDVPDLTSAESQFFFSAGAVPSNAAGPFVCPFNDTSVQYPGLPTLYGKCSGQGHISSITVSLVHEPATLALTGIALLGAASSRRRRG